MSDHQDSHQDSEGLDEVWGTTNPTDVISEPSIDAGGQQSTSGSEALPPIVALDIETTGLNPFTRQVWEIGMIRRDEQGDREVQFFVDVDLSLADPFALKIGRFYERHPLGRKLAGLESPAGAEGALLDEVDPFDLVPWTSNSSLGSMTTRKAAELVVRWTHGAHIVGAVPNFDTETLSRLVYEHDLTWAWHYHLIDIENLAVGYLCAKGQVPSMPWKSDDLSAAVGVEPLGAEDRHTALGDAKWALAVYDAITGDAQRRGLA